MDYETIEELRADIDDETVDPNKIDIGWQSDEWGYQIQAYLGPVSVYRYVAGNCPWESTTTVRLDWALSPKMLCEMAKATAEDMAEELGIPSDQIFEEETDV